ncbi:LexA family transcriptional regulator [Jiella endophytica]|uniref:LexA family transcriptional regulator n=1 Tax=Jiella endophytica TaxID=2558362 RepID=A0A4Y8RGF0_9HYPH|nr:LexA family transcriptional regulator [Jiella endophytica]TFF20793.1 LexA family transcriptional regulator [Jiella endophytica]
MTSALARIIVRDMADATNNHTAEALHARISERLADLGLSANAAAIRSGLSRDFVRNTLRRPGQVPHTDNLQKLANGLETTFEWLRWGRGEKTPGVQASEKSEDRGSQAEAGRPLSEVLPIASVNLDQMREAMPPNMPVYGTAAASLAVRHEGAFEMESRVVEFVRRPPALMQVPEAYAFYVAGNSMVPAHMPGDLRFVHPYKPPRQGDTVVVQAQYAEHSGVEAFVGIYDHATSDKLFIRKLNPDATVEFSARHLKAVHRVLTLNELFGV